MSRTLILNRSFRAVAVADWPRAVTLVYRGLAEALDHDLIPHDFAAWVKVSSLWDTAPGGFIHSPNLRMAVPEVVRLCRYDRVPSREVAFTRHNIYARYRYRCCYCGRRFPPAELNLDHVVPRSRGGVNDWSNVVSACRPCNLRKADRLPDELGMTLLVKPEKPDWGAFGVLGGLAARSPHSIPESWRRLLSADA